MVEAERKPRVEKGYRRKRDEGKPEVEKNEIWVDHGKNPGSIANQVQEKLAGKEKKEDQEAVEPLDSVVLKGRGTSGIAAVVAAVEVVKRRVPGLHQTSQLVTTVVEETWEPRAPRKKKEEKKEEGEKKEGEEEEKKEEKKEEEAEKKEEETPALP
eukprot:Hpha_TRINITY_DN15032_c7_g1::TRINITY_DN15032_c7_g1_i2::g.124286::m.124286